MLVNFANSKDNFTPGRHVSLAVLHLVALCDEVCKGIGRAHTALKGGCEAGEVERLLDSDTRLRHWSHCWLLQVQSGRQHSAADQFFWTYERFLYNYVAMIFIETGTIAS